MEINIYDLHSDQITLGEITNSLHEKYKSKGLDKIEPVVDDKDWMLIESHIDSLIDSIELSRLDSEGKVYLIHDAIKELLEYKDEILKAEKK
jgi:hypothetical protein